MSMFVSSHLNLINGAQPENLQISSQEIEEAYALVSQDLIEAIKAAAQNISTFHKRYFEGKRGRD